MKLKSAIILPVMMLLFLQNAFAYSTQATFDDNRTLDFNENIWCTVNGQFLDFNSNGVPFFCYTENLPEGLVNYVPVRTIAEALSLEVAYDSPSHAIELKGNGKVMRFWVGSSDISFFDWEYNNTENSFFATQNQTPCPVRLIDGTTYVPIRAVTEAFDRFIDFKSNQLIIADSLDGLVPLVKENLSKKIEIYGISPDICVSTVGESEGFLKFLEINDLDNLTGFLCRKGSTWSIGTTSSKLYDYNKTVAPKYFENLYFKPDEKANWTKFGDDENTNSIYDISFKVTEVTTDKNTRFVFESTDEISDSNYKVALECLEQNTVLPITLKVEEYSASYSPVITDKNIDSTLYRFHNPSTSEYFYVLLTDSEARFFDKSVFDDINFTENATVSLPGLGSLTVYSEVIIVDITDDDNS